MKKSHGKWSLFIIISATAFASWSVLPNIISYTQDTNKPIEHAEAMKESKEILERIFSIDNRTIEWINAFCKHIDVKPVHVEIDSIEPQFIHAQFVSEKEASLFKALIYKAGPLIIENSMKLTPIHDAKADPLHVTILRQQRFNLKEEEFPLNFIQKWSKEKTPTKQYKEFITERAINMAKALEQSQYLNKSLIQEAEIIQQIVITCEILRSITSLDKSPDNELASDLVTWICDNDPIIYKKIANKISRGKTKLEDSYRNSDNKQQTADQIEDVSNILDMFTNNPPSSWKDLEPADDKIPLSHPLFESVCIDWESSRIIITPSFILKETLKPDGIDNLQQIREWALSEITYASNRTGEKITPGLSDFFVNLGNNKQTGIITLDIKTLLKREVEKTKTAMIQNWTPKDDSLSPVALPIVSMNEWMKLSPKDKRMCILIHAPGIDKHCLHENLKKSSVYIVMMGLRTLVEDRKGTSQEDQLEEDLKDLFLKLIQRGFQSQEVANLGISVLKDAMLFELISPCKGMLVASREKFTVLPTIAFLEIGTIKQRLKDKNTIERDIQEDLIKWRDSYKKAQSSLNKETQLTIPPPTRSPVWNNIVQSIRAKLRGDDKNLIKLGLDLSGGKSVRISLTAPSGEVVKDKRMLLKGREELVNRVNKMGLSEIAVRVEDSNLLLDFPGSNELSASELIEATTMTFHIVNEKFSPDASGLYHEINSFLQRIWNEASLFEMTSIEGLNRLAYEHLHGDKKSNTPETDTLIDAGLRFCPPGYASPNSSFDEEFSIIVPVAHGKDANNNRHPLFILMRNYVIKGSDLKDIRVAYDYNHGYSLSFGVKTKSDSDTFPREDLFNWTSIFSRESVIGSPRQIPNSYSGWRMAVVLNDEIISAPEIHTPLNSGASISGKFSQREITHLCNDLKAGSLTFKPQILSEEKISAEVSKGEKLASLTGFAFATISVVAIMVIYYRFWGIIACAALMFNLLLIFASLQELGTTLTLSGIAGIILTLGMAVDSNVLVFERIREELNKGIDVFTAVQMGYKKALTAVIDSSITTMLACAILASFQSGPVKGFAISLAIGLITSIFTSVFVTKVFFVHFFSKNRSSKYLNMLNFFGSGPLKVVNFFPFVMIVSVCIVSLGFTQLWIHKDDLFGIDLTGGMLMNIDCSPSEGNIRGKIVSAFTKSGISINKYRIQERGSPEKIRIYISKQTSGEQMTYKYIKEILQEEGIQIQNQSSKEGSWSSVSGQLSETMRINALIAIGLSLLLVTLYISIRFELPYAIASLAGILHNMITTGSCIGMLHYFEVPIQIDMQVIGALMTTIGYCLNDTIIIFDRVREEENLNIKGNWTNIIETAVGATLGRTAMTCATTAAVLLSVIIFGGQTTLSFSVVILIGILMGPISSSFAALPMLYILKK